MISSAEVQRAGDERLWSWLTGNPRWRRTNLLNASAVGVINLARWVVKRGDIAKPRKPKVKMTEAEQAAFDDAMAKLRAGQMESKSQMTRYPTTPKAPPAAVRLPYADDSVELGAEILNEAKSG